MEKVHYAGEHETPLHKQDIELTAHEEQLLKRAKEKNGTYDGDVLLHATNFTDKTYKGEK